MAHIPDNFQINITSSRRADEGGIINSANRMDINLTLSDQRRNKERYGLYSGTATNGSYGYIEKNGDTYVWLVPVVRGAKYDITEKNYDIIVDNISYGIAAQYSVTQTQEGVDNESRTPWFGTVNRPGPRSISSGRRLPACVRPE